MSGSGDWKTEPLGRIARLTMGQSPESKYYSEEESGWPFLQGCAEFQSRLPAAKLFCTQKRKLGKEGAILFSVRAPVGRINIADRDYVIGRGLAAIEGSDVDHNYLEQYLHYIAPSFRNASQGSTFEAINSGELSAWPISHPSDKPDQVKIAEILSTVDRAIEETDALIAKQQRIKTGLMQDLLIRGIDGHGKLRTEETHDFKDSSLGRIPMEWDVRTLAECAERVVVGLASSTTHAYRDVGTPMIRNQNIRRGYFDDQEMLFLDPTFAASFPNKATRKGDVLTVRTGANVGDTALVPEKYVGCPTFTTLITSTKKRMLLPAYLVWYVESHAGQTELNRVMVGGGKENLNVGQFVNFRVAVPPLEEQETALKYLEGIKSQLTAGKVALTKLRKLKTALMQDLLTGKKRVSALLDPVAQPIRRVS